MIIYPLKKGSHTNPSKATEQLGNTTDRLNFLRKCPKLNDRLFQYADVAPDAPGVRPEDDDIHHQQQFQQLYGVAWNSTAYMKGVSSEPRHDNNQGQGTRITDQFPAGDAQYQEIVDLGCWFMSLHRQDHEGRIRYVENEEAVVSEFQSQLVTPLQHLLLVSVDIDS